MLIVLIHNHDRARLEAVRPKIRDLCARNPGWNRSEIVWQPPTVPSGRMRALGRLRDQAVLDMRWAAYRGRPMSRFGAAKALLRHLRVFALDTGSWRRRSAIEEMLTTKHLRAWARLLDGEQTGILVLEDDVVFRPDSMAIIEAVLRRIDERIAAGTRLYVDMAGGLAENDLGADKLIRHKADGIIEYAKPVTNTSCGYYMSRALVERFLTLLHVKPWRRLPPADWTINDLMMRLADAREPCVGWTTSPPALDHGSKTGAFDSSIASAS